MRRFLWTAALVAAIGMSAAVPAYADGGGEFFGTLAGAGFGGLIGNQFGHGPGRVATTAAGVFVGGLVGNSVGRSIDRQSAYDAGPVYASGYYPYYYSSYYYPEPFYYQTTYVPNYVAPPPSYQPVSADPQSSSYCREYTQKVRIEGRLQESYGTACLQPDGTWRVTQ